MGEIKNNQNDYLVFIASLVSNNYDRSDSDLDENVSIIEEWCEEYQLLLNECIKITTTNESLKNENCVLKEEEENHLENIHFLDNEHRL